MASPRAMKQFVVLTLEFRKEAGSWLGRCRELGTATDGRSLERVKRELIELVTLHLDELEDVGERQRFFKEHGIRLYSDHPPAQVQRELEVAPDDGPFVQPVSIPVGPTDRALLPA